MKEDLYKYLEDYWTSGRDNDLIENFLISFFKSYQPERLNPEGIILSAMYGNKFCTYCREENCVCDSPTTENK